MNVKNIKSLSHTIGLNHSLTSYPEDITLNMEGDMLTIACQTNNEIQFNCDIAQKILKLLGAKRIIKDNFYEDYSTSICDTCDFGMKHIIQLTFEF